MKQLILSFILIFSFQANAESLLDSARVGLDLNAISIPHPLSLGVDVKLMNGLVGLSVSKGLMTSFSFDNTDIKIDSFDIGVRTHPFRGAFYVGVLYGTQELTVKRTEEYFGQSVDMQAKLKGNYLTPNIGWQWMLSNNFYLGMNLGWQINSGARTSISTSQDNNPIIINHPEFQKSKNDLIKIGNELGNTAIPNIGLLRIGYYF